MRANWTAVTDDYPEVHVVYSAGAGSGSPVDPNTPYFEGDLVRIIDGHGVTAPPGMRFIGWSASADAESVDHEAGSSLLLTDEHADSGEIMLHAVYENLPVYQVVLSGGGSEASGFGTYHEGELVTLFAGTRSGFAFSGWKVNAGGVTLSNYTAPQTTFMMPGANVEVTAEWERIPESILYATITHFGEWSGAGHAEARIDAPIEKFVRLWLGDSIIDERHYTVREGSTIITFNEAYLLTLANGTYEYVAEYTDGEALIVLEVSRLDSLPAVTVNPDGSGSAGTSGNLAATFDLEGAEILAMLGLAIFAVALIALSQIHRLRRRSRNN